MRGADVWQQKNDGSRWQFVPENLYFPTSAALDRVRSGLISPPLYQQW